MLFKRFVCGMILFVFGSTGLIPPSAYSQSILPTPSRLLSLTPAFHPVMIQGMRFHPDNFLQFDFIVDTGDASVDINGPTFKEETTRLIKYFLASMTVPDKEMWVNLSPYEKDRIIANGLGQTELGRDMLSQDYILKQLISSLIYPDTRTGKSFWKEIYAKTRKTFGTTNIPINTFNKVWIVPDKAVVYERGNTVYIAESHLKVMLEEDYFAIEKNQRQKTNSPGTHFLASKIIRDIVLPELEKEVNTGKNFANLRQIYHAMILAAWFKVNLQKSLLGRVYANKNKTKGVDALDQEFRGKIFQQYLKSFKKGVYNYIREENDPVTGQVIPRKYFSGGMVGVDAAMIKVKTGPIPQTILNNHVGRNIEVDSAMTDVTGTDSTHGPDIERINVDDDTVNRIQRYEKEKVSVHIALSSQAKPEQKIIMAMPQKDTEIAFYCNTFSDKGNFKWTTGNITPVVEGAFRGVDVDFKATTTNVNLDFRDNSNNLALRDIIGLRMVLYDKQNVAQQESELMARIFALPQAQQEELERLIGVPLSTIIIPKVEIERLEGGSHMIKVTKTTFDGRHHYRLFIHVPAQFSVDNQNGFIKINGFEPLELGVRAITDFDPLTPPPLNKIFNAGALEEMRSNPEFREIAENFALLFYKEKLLAGSWIYLAYFGRDTLVSARLMWPSLSSWAKMVIAASVLDRMGGSKEQPQFNGLVAVNDEDSGERLFYVSVTEKRGLNPDVFGMFKAVLNNPKRLVLVYKVLDSTFLLPGVEKRLFDDLTDDELAKFLDLENARQETNMVTILRHWNRILELTDPYTQAIRKLSKKNPQLSLKKVSQLEEFKKLSKLLVGRLPGAPDINWRDSPYGIGWGEFAADINTALAPNSIDDIAGMIQRLNRIKKFGVQTLAAQNGFKTLEDYWANDGRFRQAKQAWSTAIEHFKIHLKVGQLRDFLTTYLRSTNISAQRKEFFPKLIISRKSEPVVTVQDFIKGVTPQWLNRGISFTGISLGVGIMHSDETYSLLDKDLDSRNLNRILDNLFSPNPMGLWNDDVGLFIANAIFSGNKAVLKAFDKEKAYHGQFVLWSKPMRELKLGLIRQLRFAKRRRNNSDIKRLEEALMKVVRVERNVGKGAGLSEIWTWVPGLYGMIPGDYRQLDAKGNPDGQPKGYPQLWANSTDIREPEHLAALERINDEAGDDAMSAKVASVVPGGIDLNSKMLDLQTIHDGKSMAYSAGTDWAMNVNGFRPVIIRIKPMASPMFSD